MSLFLAHYLLFALAMNGALGLTAGPRDASPLTFEAISSAQRCSPARFSWTYDGSHELISLYIQSADEKDMKTKAIAVDLDTSTRTFVWPEVTVDPGWYTLRAELSTTSADSPAFYISDGPCLPSPHHTIHAEPRPVESPPGVGPGVIAAAATAGASFFVLAIVTYYHSWCNSLPDYQPLPEDEESNTSLRICKPAHR